MYGKCESIEKPGEKIGIGEYSIAVEHERVKESVESFGYRGVEHELDRVVFTNWMIVVRNRELDQFHTTSKHDTTEMILKLLTN